MLSSESTKLVRQRNRNDLWLMVFLFILVTVRVDSEVFYDAFDSLIIADVSDSGDKLYRPTLLPTVVADVQTSIRVNIEARACPVTERARTRNLPSLPFRIDAIVL
jgi:hypothetical protein